MALSRGARVWLGRAGALLSVAGIVFVVQRMAAYAGEIDASAIGLSGWLALVLLMLAYSAANILLARAWWHVLRQLGVAADWRWALGAFATSQLAKYVPGNVMQFAGRQALGVAAGIANRPLLLSTLFELALLCGLALLFAPLAGIGPPVQLAPWLAAAAFTGLTALALVGLGRFAGPELLRAGLCHLGYIAGASAVFAGCAVVAGVALSPQQVPMVMAAYVLAWVVGLATPGAPAGLGVRDGLLLLMLGGLADPPTILLAVVMGRAITVTGDVLFFLAGSVIGRPQPSA